MSQIHAIAPQVWNIPSCQKEVSHSLAIALLSPISLIPKQPLIHFLSLCVGQFWPFCINGITQYEAFCAWRLCRRVTFSRFAHVVVCAGTPDLCLAG